MGRVRPVAKGEQSAGREVTGAGNATGLQGTSPCAWLRARVRGAAAAPLLSMQGEIRLRAREGGHEGDSMWSLKE